MVAGFVHGVSRKKIDKITSPETVSTTSLSSAAYHPAFVQRLFPPQRAVRVWTSTGRPALEPSTGWPNASFRWPRRPTLRRLSRSLELSLHHEFSDGLLRRILGLASAGPAKDAGLARAFWTFLGEFKAPFEQVFFDWHGGLASARRAQDGPALSFYAHPAFEPVLSALRRVTLTP